MLPYLPYMDPMYITDGQSSLSAPKDCEFVVARLGPLCALLIRSLAPKKNGTIGEQLQWLVADLELV